MKAFKIQDLTQNCDPKLCDPKLRCHHLQPDFSNPQQISQFGVCRTRPDEVTVANNTVPVYVSFPSAPLDTGLSSTAVVGVTLGAVAACALVAGGAYLYYRYNRSDNSEAKRLSA